MDNTKTSSSGLGIGSIVFLVFLTLKLVGIEPVASWSWWWVTAPLWISALLIVGIVILLALIMFIATSLKNLK